MNSRTLKGGHIPVRALYRIRFEVLVQVALFGESLVTGKRSGSDKDRAKAFRSALTTRDAGIYRHICKRCS